jgi:class 3 adenylate cyclase
VRAGGDVTDGSTIGASDAYREVHFLLGDWCEPTLRSVPDWCTRLDNSEGLSLTGVAGLDAYMRTSSAFEAACADLYDSHVKRAYSRFGDVAANAKLRMLPRLEALARIGAAHAQALLKRHAVAQKVFSHTIIDDPVLVLVIQLLATLNLSNWGTPAGEPDAIAHVPAGLPQPLAQLLAAYRAYVVSRLCLRTGARTDGLEALNTVTGQPAFAHLPPIIRGHLLRMTGILLDVSGRRPRGRGVLEKAFAIYEAAGYDHGIVQTAISLTRVTEAIDPEQTRWYLGRAEEIVDQTDAPGQERSSGRQMLGERASLYSRRAHLEFAAGHIDSAIKLCEQDLAQVRQLANNLPEGLPREEANVHRHLGRMLLATKRHAEAEVSFARSAALFAQVGDVMNVFFSRARRFTALAALGRLDDAALEVGALEAILFSRTKQDVREKEEAILETLQATLYWRRSQDAVMAQAMLGRALDTLHRYGRDYYYGIALMLDAEILEGSGDRISAHHRLLEARACAIASEAEDLRRVVDERLATLPIEGGNTIVHEQLSRVELTVVFANLRQFTQASARIEPTKMATFISEFAQRVSRGTVHHGGHPTRFFGDSAMALFGLNRAIATPKERLAALAACEIYELFRNLRKQWDHTAELATIGLGFGIATGEVTIGRFGWRDLSEFSAIGERVDLAVGLQACSRDGEVTLCDETFRRLCQLHVSVRGDERTEILKDLGTRAAFRARVANLVDDLSTQAPHRGPY